MIESHEDLEYLLFANGFDSGRQLRSVLPKRPSQNTELKYTRKPEL